MKNIDTANHTMGRSAYIDDVLVPEATLYGCVYYSQLAHGKILQLNLEQAKVADGVVKIYTYEDIPGVNQIGGIFPDEPLFAEGEVHFWGQPVALVIAESERAARLGCEMITMEVEALPVIIDPREAASKEQLIMPPLEFKLGNTEESFKECDYVVKGVAESGGQEHLYLEPQGAVSTPLESGGVKISSATQGPTAVQRTASKVLGIPMHLIEVDVQRLGGGFGGKEDQATPWAVMTAIAAIDLNRSVKMVLHRIDDMRMTGKRHPYSSDFKIGLNKEGKILAYEVTFFQNAGAAADLSPPVLGRSLFHCTNSYFIPHVKATGYSCRTNLPPNTAFRGFGGPQGMFVIEAAIRKAAEVMGVNAWEIQKTNLLDDGKLFPYGQEAERCQARTCWTQCEENYDFEKMKSDVDSFNKESKAFKKGLAFMPICFGISFTKTPMNQASALIHVYQDGSISVSTGAVEMGQGVYTKILQVAAEIFSLDPSRITIHSTNTSRVANTSPTAASSGADLNGKATERACLELRQRFFVLLAEEMGGEAADFEIRKEKIFRKGEECDLDWVSLVDKAFLKRVNLSCQAHYATPEIHFDDKKSWGKPFAYHVYGTSITEVTIDCLRGRYVVDAVRIVHDFGKTMNSDVDLGQVEGALLQGIGWMTIEELLFTDKGRPMTDTLSSYKIPDIYCAPAEVDVAFLENSENPMGIFNSKAVGEPPLMYGIGTFFALREAMKAFSPDKSFDLSAPLTPEKVLVSLYADEMASVS
ncbi:MAG: xanthine dehydrogenase large subunit [Chlamydiales bacterium]|jgi:xanthine dehydrogenase large subunit